MTSCLKKMSEPAFLLYLEEAIPEYAKENVESGRWPKEGAIERSKSDFERLLPNGTQTENNYLFEIITPETEYTVGALWLSIENHAGLRSAFIFDIKVNEKYRRQGFATSALKETEALVKKLGACNIGLHVFRQNSLAKNLYESLGWNTVSFNMAKSLA